MLAQTGQVLLRWSHIKVYSVRVIKCSTVPSEVWHHCIAMALLEWCLVSWKASKSSPAVFFIKFRGDLCGRRVYRETI